MKIERGYFIAASVLRSQISGCKWVLALLVETEYTSHVLERSRPSWLIHLHLRMLFLQLLQPQPRMNAAKNRQRSQMRITDLLPLTNPFKAVNSARIIWEKWKESLISLKAAKLWVYFLNNTGLGKMRHRKISTLSVYHEARTCSTLR